MSRRAPTRDREDYSHHTDPKPDPPRERSASPPRNLIKMKMKPLEPISISNNLASSLGAQAAGHATGATPVGSAPSPASPPPPAPTPSSARIDVAKAAAAATESATASAAEALLAGPSVNQLPPRTTVPGSGAAPASSNTTTTTLPPASSLTPAPTAASASASSAAAAAVSPQPQRLRVNVENLNISPADAARINLQFLQEHFREPYHRHPRWQTEEGKAKKSKRKQVRCAECKRRCSTYCPGCSEEKVTGFCGVNIKDGRHCFEEYHIKMLIEKSNR